MFILASILKDISNVYSCTSRNNIFKILFIIRYYFEDILKEIVLLSPKNKSSKRKLLL